jgi:hypothetical protein
MAHFAELDKNNLVVRVCVVDNINTCDEHGEEKEEVGVKYLQSIFGENTTWKQTSYNGKFRALYAATGFAYNEELDCFLPPKPFDSWILNKETKSWEAPTERPEKEGYIYFWDEKQLEWIEQEFISPLIN